MKPTPSTSLVKILMVLSAGVALAALSLKAETAPAPKASSEVTVTGEVLDMACYLDHGAHGAKHAECAKTCISKGLPVGLKGNDGKTYLLVGEHKPANEELAKHAAETITVHGKLVERDGINLLENIEIVKS